jgi:predicted DNA-binding protein (UPF0251 family)
MDEFEALRLSDYMGLPQEQAAQSMHISQQTFSRILQKARKGLATGLVKGATLKIQGGHYVVSTHKDFQPNSRAFI